MMLATTADARGTSTPQPQPFVVCRGIHALCSFADHCPLSADGSRATCRCWDVSDDFIVVTAVIEDPEAREATQARCTLTRPCLRDEAPVCATIAAGQFKVHGVTAFRVSAFSYADFCRRWKPVSCPAGPWGSCMSAACVPNGRADRPLDCDCPVFTTIFTGPQGACDQPPGTVMSTIDVSVDVTTLPGYEFALEACRLLE